MPDDRHAKSPASAPTAATPAAQLLTGPVHVINVGLEGFARELASAGAAVQQVAWTPPAGGDPVLAALLAKLDG